MDIRTIKKNRNAAHGKAACTGSYWTTISPISLNLFTHFVTFSSISLTVTSSPLVFRNRHCLLLPASICDSISSRIRCGVCPLEALIVWSWSSKLRYLRSSFDKRLAASSHRLFFCLIKKRKTGLAMRLCNEEIYANLRELRLRDIIILAAATL